ncbi:glycosyltransferase [Ligilactobacillus saerimneri]|uniref:glycosyltransferase n=1 Tax=Ligilactobacillus saerimneri TaxID=228229 RepID=UPI0030CEFE37
MKVKVLQVVSDIIPDSGVQKVLMEYFRHFYQEVTYDFIYWGEQDPAMIKEIEELGGNVYKIVSPLKISEFRREWNEFCQNHNGEYDIFENSLVFLGFFFKDVKKTLGVRVSITHSHTNRFGDSKLSNLRNKLFYHLTGSVTGDVLFSCTKKAGHASFGKKIQRKPWYVINNAFELAKFKYNLRVRNEVRQEMGWTDKYVITNVGRFSPPKNHKLIMTTFAELNKTNPNAQLVLIGSGPLREKIVTQARELKVDDKVSFLGVRNDVQRLLQGTDTFFFPSIFEGLGIALVEAQVAGAQCLASDVIPEEANITNYQHLSLKASPADWAQKLRELVDSSRITDGYVRAVKAGFDINTEAEKLQHLYAKLISRG